MAWTPGRRRTPEYIKFELTDRGIGFIQRDLDYSDLYVKVLDVIDGEGASTIGSIAYKLRPISGEEVSVSIDTLQRRGLVRPANIGDLSEQEGVGSDIPESKAERKGAENGDTPQEDFMEFREQGADIDSKVYLKERIESTVNSRYPIGYWN